MTKTKLIPVNVVDWSGVSWFVYGSPAGVRAAARRLKPGQMRKGESLLLYCPGVSRKTAVARGRGQLARVAAAA